MADRPRPTLPSPDRIQLGAELRRLREATGKTIDQVSRELTAELGAGFSPTKLSRLETGKRPASQRDVRDLCLYYEAPKDELARLVELAKAARALNRWQGLTDAFAEYMALEQIAERVRTYENMLIPGLLQTADYSRAMAVGNVFDQTGAEDEGADVDIKINVRLARQERLHADPPLSLHAIIDENAVRRGVGGADVMAAQLRHLHEISRLSSVVLQIVPISRGSYPGLESGSFSILDFAPGAHVQDHVCFLETTIGAVWAEREVERLRISRIFRYMEGFALSPSDTRTMLESIIRGMTGS